MNTTLSDYFQVDDFLQNRAKQFNFFQLVLVLHKLKNIDVDSYEWFRNYEILFTANPSLGFAASDVSRLHIVGQRIEVETTFLGLNGSQSPLPNFFLDALATSDNDGTRRDFLDYFNHNILAMLYQIWHKYRYYLCFKENATDQTSARLFSLIGLGSNDLRQEGHINWCKMLSYIGVLSGRSRSPQVVNGIIEHYFDLQASITQWQIRKVKVPLKYQMCLGKKNAHLGTNMILGASVLDCTSKFILKLKMLSFKRFKDFLPIGEQHETLKEVLRFVLKTQMDYELILELAPYEAPAFNLSHDHGAYLGWTSFLGDPSTAKQVSIHIKA